MSKLRSDELVNMEGDGAPSFPQGATSIEPTANNQVATKLYVDSALSAASGNAVSDTAPTNPAVGSFWTDTSVSPSLLKTWNGSMWIEFAGTAGAAVGVVVSLPSLSATNLEHAPATITASAAQVSGATLFITKWYKDDVEIVGATGSTYVATEPGVYRYEERWADNAGNILTPSLNKTIELLTIQAPSIISPVVDTGVPDFDYTAESSAITNVGTVDISDGDAFGITTYTGNGITKTINTGIDLSGDGGMIWIKARSVDEAGVIVDTERGITKRIYPTAAVAESTDSNMVSSASSDGFVIGSSNVINTNNATHVAWSFRKAPGFFDIVTYQGNNLTPQLIPHSLGSVPGMILARNLDSGQNWAVYHKDFGPDHVGILNSTMELNSGSEQWNNNVPTSTEFSVGASGDTNRNTDRHVAYLFADNPSNQIKCGTFSNNTGSWGPPAPSDAVVDCGFQPRFILAKASSTSGWYMMDVERGWSTSGDHQVAYRNASVEAQQTNAEVPQEGNFNFNATSTGFEVTYSRPGNWLFMAIGSPQAITSQTQLTLTDTTVSKISDGTAVSGSTIDQVLTVGETVQADTVVSSTVATPVFSATTYTGSGSAMSISTGIDLTTKGLLWFKGTGGSGYANNSHGHFLFDSERGNYGYYLKSSDSDGNGDFASYGWAPQPAADGTVSNLQANLSHNNVDWVSWAFRAAPGFFDVVSWSGNSVNGRQISHDLGSAPGMILIKNLTNTANWEVWHNSFDADDYMGLNATNPKYETSGPWNNTLPTSEHFTVSSDMDVNRTGDNYVAYLFADDTPGLIKCGTYTGTGSSQTIDTGFKPKFVLTKSRSHSSDWYLMDSENPGKALYTNWGGPAQNVPIGYVNNGFTVDGANSALNASGYEYIYLAIAENAETDITSDIYASGTVSASSGSTITLSDVSGTWSTGMKIQGVTTDTRDNPDPIDASAVTFTSSEPATTSGTVSTWDYAEWNLSHDSAFSGVVHQKAVPLTATGTQAGPDDFTIQAGTEYFVRTKYASSLPTGQSDWSAVTRFLTKAMVYADDVFNTYLYEGNNNSLTIDNGIDLAGEGGMVWIKRRTESGGKHVLFDTERGATKRLYAETAAESTASGSLTSFNNTGFSLGDYSYENRSGGDHVAWTFRKAPGFFDIVTYTGDGLIDREVSHSLDSVPGMIMVKKTSGEGGWYVWHRNLGGTGRALTLHNTDTLDINYNLFPTLPTSTAFSPGDNSHTNQHNQTYVAYIFAHDDARFGINGDESIIKCGSYTGNGSSNGPEIELGFEPQFLLYKNITQATNWEIIDTMRGMPNTSGEHNGYMTLLRANDDNVEGTDFSTYPTSTGFKITNAGASNNGTNNTYIFVAIRRPHKPPTLGTQVFMPISRSGTGQSETPITGVGFAPDTYFSKILSNGNTYQNLWFDKLIGPGTYVKPAATAQANTSSNIHESFDQDGVTVGNGNNANGGSQTYINYFFKRAPGFYDTVVYTGTGSAQQVNHNLGVTPELMICKPRTTNNDWVVYNQTDGASKVMYFNLDLAAQTETDRWNNTAPTSTEFSVGTAGATNGSGQVYSAYLFASQSGVSKVGIYTGTGSDINIDCGFTSGARFILIKRTDTTGDWYIWDTARGITSGNDPYLMLNNTDAQVTNTDYIDPLNAGFTVTSSAPAALNETGGTYLFLAIS